MTFNKLPYPQAPCDVQVELTVYPMFDGNRGALKLPFALARGQEVMDALNIFMRRYHVHATLTTSLLSLINDAIRSTLKSQVNEAFLKRSSNKTEEEITVVALKFKKMFEPSKTPASDEQDTFSEAIRCLCNSTEDSGILLHLVKLEDAYNIAYSCRMKNWDSQMEFITLQQHDEIQDGRQTLPEQALNTKRLQFSKDFEMLKQTRDAELSELRENQKTEFRQWVGLLYSTYQAWLKKEDSADNHKDFVDEFGEGFGTINDLAPATFQYFFKNKENVSKELCGVLGLDKRSSRSTFALPNNEENISDPALSELKAMGFGEIDARCALRLTNGNMDLAVVLLLDSPEQLQTEIQRETTRPKTPSSDAKAGTNLIDITRNWLGKTFESLSREDPKNDTLPKELKVSFTAVLGSHLRTPYQITLTASDPLNDNTESTRLNTLNSLYKPELTFRLVFFHPKYATKYHLGRVANIWLFDACSRTNELHFPSLSYQLASAIDKLQTSKASLQEGDFLITRHSNLSNTHVIVHMVLDHSSNAFPEDLNHRPLLIGGMRSLLITAQRYAALKLVLPLPELTPTNLQKKLSTNPNLIKLFETFFRCIKGLLLETNRCGSIPYPVIPGATIPPLLDLTFLMSPTTNPLLFKKTRTCIKAAFNP